VEILPVLWLSRTCVAQGLVRLWVLADYYVATPVAYYIAALYVAVGVSGPEGMTTVVMALRGEPGGEEGEGHPDDHADDDEEEDVEEDVEACVWFPGRCSCCGTRA
jgi:hypothetical protein